MSIWGSKEHVYTEDAKIISIVMSGLIVITAIIIYGVVLVAEIG